jgi:hypothetical protein
MIDLICTVLKSSHIRIKNKLIIHPSPIYFSIMHRNPNPKQDRSGTCGNWRERESRSSRTSHAAMLQPMDHPTTEQRREVASRTDLASRLTPVWQSRAADHAAAPPSMRSLFQAPSSPLWPAADIRAIDCEGQALTDWLRNTVCIRSIDMGLDGAGPN